MLIKEYLEKSKSHLIYPESYYSGQIEEVEEILKRFRYADITTKRHQRLQVRDHGWGKNLRTIVISPIEGDCIVNHSITAEYPSKTGEKKGYHLISSPAPKAKHHFMLIIRGISLKEEKEC